MPILRMTMADHLWTVVSLCSASVATLWLLTAAGRRRTRGSEGAELPDINGPGVEELAGTVDAGELQLALLFRRMRAWLRNPYDFAASRITTEAEFEECLDLAVRLSIRIADLCGAVTTEGAERERIRGQILEGLMRGSQAGRAGPPGWQAGR
jgi:hypothetical protein